MKIFASGQARTHSGEGASDYESMKLTTQPGPLLLVYNHVALVMKAVALEVWEIKGRLKLITRKPALPLPLTTPG